MSNTQPAHVAILAGGMGTRLRARTGNLPKPMAPVAGRPVLQHLIELCRLHGFTRIALLVHYEHDIIRHHFGDGGAYGVDITYCVEAEARGTAGALLDALPTLAPRFLVLYGDTYADVDLAAIWQRHAGAAGAAATLLLHPNDHPHDSDLVEVDSGGHICAVHPYPHADSAMLRNLVNAALYVMEADAVRAAASPTEKGDVAKHMFPSLLAQGRVLQAHVTPEYIKDMGTPERLDKVGADIVAGVPEALSGRQPRRAVFLDRDGTLNVEVGHLRAPDQLQLLPRVGAAVRRLNRSGVLAVGVTNQPVLARGDVSAEGLERIHARLDGLLGAEGAYLDRLYVCPHHPDSGFAGEVAALKIVCDCRKPGAGLLDRAVRDLNIDRRRSWVVGDSTADIMAGARAGVRTVLVRTGHAGNDGKYACEPDYIMSDLSAAVDWVLSGHDATVRRLLPVAQAATGARLVLVGGPARAGKSSAARVLAELLQEAGRTAHVIAMDGWLRPLEKRPETLSVAARYDLDALTAALTTLLRSAQRHALSVPVYDRRQRATAPGRSLSIGPNDVLIVEGVPALMTPALVAAAEVRLFVDVDDLIRMQRLEADYGWRGGISEAVRAALATREHDEVPAVRHSAASATHHIITEAQP